MIQNLHTLLSSLGTERLELAVERKQDLYQSLQDDPRIDSASLRCFLQAYNRSHSNGSEALAILEAWNLVWIGDTELSPKIVRNLWKDHKWPWRPCNGSSISGDLPCNPI